MSKKPIRLNSLALARRDKPLMTSFKADPGYVFVSADLGSGEPTCIAHYTKDKNYYDAILGMKGKKPYINHDGLKIDDIYVTNMYNFPMLRPTFETVMSKSWPAGDWAEQWVTDKEVILEDIEKTRQLAKIMVLGLGYGLGPKKMTQITYDAGYTVTLDEARAVFKAYWKWAADVKKFADVCAAIYKRDKKIPNVFGYINYPEAEYKAFNAFIQSTVSGIMHWLIRDLRQRCDWFKYTATIHDELVAQIPDGRQAEFKSLLQGSTDALNQHLGWSVKITTGCVFGANLYEAK
jgi:hypothetical protein